MGAYELSTKLTLVIIGLTAVSGLVLPAAIAATLAQPNTVDSAAIIDGQVKKADIGFGAVTYSKILHDSIDSSKVVDNSLTADDLAASSVGTSEIADGAIGKADVSTSFVKLVQLLDDSAGNAAGWDPNGTSTDFTISDNAVQSASAIGITSDRHAVPDPTIPVGGLPYGVAVNPDTIRIYVTNGDETVSVIDGSTNTVIATIAAVHNAWGVAVNPDTNRIYVTNFAHYGGVSVIDGSTNTYITGIIVGGNPQGVAVNPDTNRIYVANSRDNNTSVIDGSTNTVIATIAVGYDPYGVAVNPNTNRIYVTNYDDNNVSVIDGSTNALLATYPLFGCEVVDRNVGTNFKIKCATAPTDNSKLSYSILT